VAEIKKQPSRVTQLLKEPSFDERKYTVKEAIEVDTLQLSKEDRKTFDLLGERILEYREAC